MTQVVLAPTATKIPPGAEEGVIVCGSHGGAYAGYLLAKVQPRAFVLSDAGVGKDNAGIGSLPLAESLGLAAITVSAMSARIGDPDDMLSRGVVSHVNQTAANVGCSAGMSCRDAVEHLMQSERAPNAPAPLDETRNIVATTRRGLSVVTIDSVSLVKPEDEGQIVISGSHGGIVSGQRAAVIRVQAAGAFYNDAGIGIDGAGITRLPVLDEMGIAAGTVSAASARIGDGHSTYADGVLSRVNETASRRGIEVGMTCEEAVELI